MKYLLFATFFFLVSCSHKAKQIDYREAKYDTGKQICLFYVISNHPFKSDFAPAKAIVGHHYVQDGIDSVMVNDTLRYTFRVKAVVDTIYMIATVDSLSPMKDSLGAQVIDSLTKKGKYNFTFRKPLYSSPLSSCPIPFLSFPTITQ